MMKSILYPSSFRFLRPAFAAALALLAARGALADPPATRGHQSAAPPVLPPPVPPALLQSGTPVAVGGGQVQQALVPEPFLIHLPGIAGECGIDHRLLAGLEAGGLKAKAEIYDWTCNDPGIPALMNFARNQAQAKLIADRITKQYRAHPELPIYLTSHSGGAGPAVWALEDLPQDVMVDSVLLLAPALSTHYDLTKALKHVRNHAYVFSSPLDAAILGAGTKLFGTIDRQHEDAAGKAGFVRPEGGDADQYRKLVACPYQEGWMKLDNLGDHMGVTATPFAKTILAPLLVGGEKAKEALTAGAKEVVGGAVRDVKESLQGLSPTTQSAQPAQAAQPAPKQP